MKRQTSAVQAMTKMKAKVNAKPKPVTRRAQWAANYTEDCLARGKRTHFCGCAKVSLHSLSFLQSSAREIDEATVDHLLSSFQLAGCLRLDPCYHVPAVIDPNFLEAALARAGATTDDLNSDDPTRWPMLELPSGAKVECLHGQHRVAAAQRYLRKNDQWWVLDLYSSGRSMRAPSTVWC